MNFQEKESNRLPGTTIDPCLPHEKEAIPNTTLLTHIMSLQTAMQLLSSVKKDESKRELTN